MDQHREPLQRLAAICHDISRLLCWIGDQQFHGTPPGWFGHGVHNCHEGDGDYAEVARILIAAGATIPTVDLPTGKAEVDAVLREHGLI